MAQLKGNWRIGPWRGLAPGRCLRRQRRQQDGRNCDHCRAGGGPTTLDPVPKATFSNSTKITNPFLPISKFHQCVLSGNDQGQQLRIVRTVTKKTHSFTINGKPLKAVVVTDDVTDTKAGQVIEKTVDYFAQDDAGNVYYLGEDVNEYEHGKLKNHEGSWRLNRDTQTAGVLMPANPKVGDVYKSEDVLPIVEETDTVVSIGKTQTINGHAYSSVMRIRENAKPPPEIEYKTYSPGTGVITEANGGVHLDRCS